MEGQNLVEYITKERVYNMPYWKANCFGLTAESLIDEAVKLRYVGGVFGGNAKASEFLCLLLKLLQIGPEMAVILEYIRQGDYKYLRCLGAFYLRLVGRPSDVYNYLEPLLSDYRKIRIRRKNGQFALSHVDEFVDSLLWNDYVCDVALPRLPPRNVLERENYIHPRKSPLVDHLGESLDDLLALEYRPACASLSPFPLKYPLPSLSLHDSRPERLAQWRGRAGREEPTETGERPAGNGGRRSGASS